VANTKGTKGHTTIHKTYT